MKQASARKLSKLRLLKMRPLDFLGCKCIAGVAQLVERHPSKVNVAGSNLVSRSKFFNSLIDIDASVY
jgi:hypothetical protein